MGRAPAVDDRVGHGDVAVVHEGAVHVHGILFQGGGSGDDLEHRARLVSVADQPVAVGGGIVVFPFIGIEGVACCHGHDGAGMGIHDDDAGPLGRGLGGHQVGQLPLAEELDVLVDGGIDVVAVVGRHVFVIRLGDGGLVGVVHAGDAAVGAGEHLVQGGFHALQALVIHAGKAQDVGGQGAHGVIALGLLHQGDPGQFLSAYLFRDLEIHLALDPDEVGLGIDLIQHLLVIHAQRSGQSRGHAGGHAGRVLGGFDHVGMYADGFGGDGQGQLGAVAVVDGAPGGGYGHVPGAHQLGFLLQLFALDELKHEQFNNDGYKEQQGYQHNNRHLAPHGDL